MHLSNSFYFVLLEFTKCCPTRDWSAYCVIEKRRMDFLPNSKTNRWRKQWSLSIWTIDEFAAVSTRENCFLGLWARKARSRPARLHGGDSFRHWTIGCPRQVHFASHAYSTAEIGRRRPNNSVQFARRVEYRKVQPIEIGNSRQREIYSPQSVPCLINTLFLCFILRFYYL